MKFAKNLFIAAFMTLAMICGCNQLAGMHANHVGNGLARVSGDVDSASRSVSSAKPHADNVGQAHLQDASESLTDAAQQLVKTTKDYEQSQRELATLQSDYAKAYNSVGNKVERLIIGAMRAIIISTILLIVACGAIQTFTGFSLTAVVGRFIGNCISAIHDVIFLPFTAARSKLVKPSVGASSE